MEEEKDNKGMKPPQTSPLKERGVRGGMVRIKMLPNRAATGVTVDADGFARVSAKEAARLIKLGYAVEAKE